MAPPKNPTVPSPSTATCHLCFVVVLLLSITTTLSVAVSTTYNSHCSSTSIAADRHTDHDDAIALHRSFELSAGYFSGRGDGLLFSPDDDDSYSARSFSFTPIGVSRTVDPNIVHVTATLELSGPRNGTIDDRPRRHHLRRRRFTFTYSVSFVLDGYYSFASNDLCMVGTGIGIGIGTADGSKERHDNAVLNLRVPRPSNLNDPFVTGRLEGADFEPVSLVAYDESDQYVYSEKSSCPAATTTGDAGAVHALQEGNFTCDQFKTLLKRSYKLEHAAGEDTSPSPASGSGHRPRPTRMHINQVHCNATGAVRAYVEFSNDTEPLSYWFTRSMAIEDAAVADGYWDSTTGRLCLTACPVVYPAVSRLSRTDLEVHECKIKMSFWFPAAWTFRDRSVVAGTLWNTAQGTSGSNSGASSDVISVSGIDDGREDLSKMSYTYTVVEEAKEHYKKTELIRSNKKKMEGLLFPGGNDSYHDFEFHFYSDRHDGSGRAYPVTIGSAMVYQDQLPDNGSVVDMKHELVNVSYDIRHFVPPEDFVRPTNGSSYAVMLHERRISAEGVYDPKRGILCMIGCREKNGSTDCKMLITVQFASLDGKMEGQRHGRGAISSLRDKTDHLFFEKINISLYGMYTGEISEAMSRMDLETIMLVTSATLSCVFAILQILHTKRNHEAPPATSITMLVVLALGYLTRLVLNFQGMFLSRRNHYVPFLGNGYVDLNEMMLRVPTLITFVLHLRLLQLTLSGRKSVDQSNGKVSSIGERKSLKICLSLYLIGGVLAGIIHAMNVYFAEENPLVVRVVEEPATLLEDLVSYAGLIQDGFLLPQIIFNAVSGSKVRAISPWFYIGGTMIRVMPHVYDVFRAHNYVPSLAPSYIYANPRDDLFSVAWDITVPLGAGLLALVLFLQQRLGGASLERRRLGEYEMVSTI